MDGSDQCGVGRLPMQPVLLCPKTAELLGGPGHA